MSSPCPRLKRCCLKHLLLVKAGTVPYCWRLRCLRHPLLAGLLLAVFNAFQVTAYLLFTASLKVFPAENFGSFAAAILIVSPVLGFLPFLAFLFD